MTNKQSQIISTWQSLIENVIDCHHCNVNAKTGWIMFDCQY